MAALEDSLKKAPLATTTVVATMIFIGLQLYSSSNKT